MADINVERKHGASVWPWIVGLIVLALLVWAVMQMGDGNAGDRALYDDTTGVAPAAETLDTTTTGFGTDTLRTGTGGVTPIDTTGAIPPSY